VIGPSFPRLLRAAQDGDEAAFAELWRDANPVLLRYLHVLSGPGSAEDVASDCWLHVVRGLAAFRGDEQAWRGWLLTTARRRAVDAGRVRQRTPAVAWQPGHEPPPAPSAETAVLTALDTRAALELVARLPAQQAEAVVLRVVAGLDPGQVAELLGTSPGAVRVAVHRGLRRLAALLEREV